MRLYHLPVNYQIHFSMPCDAGGALQSVCGVDDEVQRITPLGGGCVADVRRVEFAGGFSAVVKLSGHDDRLEEVAGS